MGLIRACYGGLKGILSGLTKSTDHPSKDMGIKKDLYWRATGLYIRSLDRGSYGASIPFTISQETVEP